MKWSRNALINLAAVVIIVGGCTSSVENSSGQSGAGGGGGTSSGSGSSSTGSASSSSSSGLGGSGSGNACGGIAGTPCGPNEYCDFPDDLCGGADGMGTCMPRPQACPGVYAPTCACDTKVYGNPCEANAAGHDVSNLGSCPAPQGMFGCGYGFCLLDVQYCERTTSDIANFPDSFICKDVPAGCNGMANCACLANEPCGSICAATPDGGFMTTCPGG